MKKKINKIIWAETVVTKDTKKDKILRRKQVFNGNKMNFESKIYYFVYQTESGPSEQRQWLCSIRIVPVTLGQERVH